MPMRTLIDPAQAGPVDWVLLCTKAHETSSVAPWLKSLCRPSTKVAVLQNGIDHIERVAPLAGGAAIVPVLVYYNGERLAHDHVRFRSVSDHELVVPDDDASRSFARLMEGTLLRVLLSDDFTTLKWRKLLLNAVANPITALTLQRQAVFDRGDIQALGLAVLDEAIKVARADGARLADDEATQTMAKLLTFPPDIGTSMYFDRLAGRPFEVEALTGAIVAAGECHGIAMPLNRALLTLLRATSDGLAASPKS